MKLYLRRTLIHFVHYAASCNSGQTLWKHQTRNTAANKLVPYSVKPFPDYKNAVDTIATYLRNLLRMLHKILLQKSATQAKLNMVVQLATKKKSE